MRFSDLVDWWVIKMQKPMILCARSTLISSEQNKKRRSRSENMRKVRLLYSQKNKIVWLSSMIDIFLRNSLSAQRLFGFFFLDCAFWMLIGWAGKLRFALLSAASVLMREENYSATFKADNAEELMIFSKRKYHTPKSRVWFALSTDNKMPRYFIFDLDFGNVVSLFCTMGG